MAPAKPARLILRTGGVRGIPLQDPTGNVDLVVRDATDGRELARAAVPGTGGLFAEIAIDLPAPASPELALDIEATGLYRAFHWFALQPD